MLMNGFYSGKTTILLVSLQVLAAPVTLTTTYDFLPFNSPTNGRLSRGRELIQGTLTTH